MQAMRIDLDDVTLARLGAWARERGDTIQELAARMLAHAERPPDGRYCLDCHTQPRRGRLARGYCPACYMRRRRQCRLSARPACAICRERPADRAGRCERCYVYWRRTGIERSRDLPRRVSA